MSNIALSHTAVSGQPVPTIGINANFVEIRDKFNTYAVQTDVAKTIAVSHLQAANMTFSDNLYDIGPANATRPRDGNFARQLRAGGIIGPSSTVDGALASNILTLDWSLGVSRKWDTALAANTTVTLSNGEDGPTYKCVIADPNGKTVTMNTTITAWFGSDLPATAFTALKPLLLVFWRVGTLWYGQWSVKS